MMDILDDLITVFQQPNLAHTYPNQQIQSGADEELSISIINEFGIRIGAICEIYDDSDDEWCIGQVIDIIENSQSDNKRIFIQCDEFTYKPPITSDSVIIIDPDNGKTGINFNIFKQQQRGCKGIIQQCQCTTRIIYALKYYQTLNLNHDENDRQRMIKFFKERYVQLLDDYIHIVTQHNDTIQLEEIFEIMLTEYGMNQCQILNCSLAIRHYRDKSIIGTKEDIDYKVDEDFLFYRDTMDQIHCYLFHLYDAGLRVRRKYKDDNDDDDDSDTSYEPNVDLAFIEIKETVKSKMKEIRKLEKLDQQQHKSNKFDLSVAVDGKQGNTYLL